MPQDEELLARQFETLFLHARAMELEKVITTLKEIVPEYQPYHRLLPQSPNIIKLAEVRDSGS